jgi:hypothetical protein
MVSIQNPTTHDAQNRFAVRVYEPISILRATKHREIVSVVQKLNARLFVVQKQCLSCQ